jgi:hypothetical protein
MRVQHARWGKHVRNSRAKGAGRPPAPPESATMGWTGRGGHEFVVSPLGRRLAVASIPTQGSLGYSPCCPHVRRDRTLWLTAFGTRFCSVGVRWRRTPTLRYIAHCSWLVASWPAAALSGWMANAP